MAKKSSLSDQVVKARRVKTDEGRLTPWREVADEFGLSQGKAIFIFECATVKPADRIKGTDAQIIKAIVRQRNKDELSWAQLAARTGWTWTKVQKAYYEAGGEKENVHRGGRYPQGKGQKDVRPDLASGKPSKPKRPAKKATKSSKKSAGTGKGKQRPKDMTPAQLVKAIKGKIITVDGEKLKVKSARRDGDMVEFTDSDDEEYVVEPKEITRIAA